MKYTIWDKKFIAILIGLFAVVYISIYFIFNIMMEWVPFNWMTIQPKISAQMPDTTHHFKDGFTMRPPVPGTIARGYLPLAGIETTAEAAKLPNPLPFNAKTLKRGQSRYLTYCSPCHGDTGDGGAGSRLRGNFKSAPSFHLAKYEKWKDGQFFQVISIGKKTENGLILMPAYANQIPGPDRWAIVHYIRVLQRAKNAKESDLD